SPRRSRYRTARHRRSTPRRQGLQVDVEDASPAGRGCPRMTGDDEDRLREVFHDDRELGQARDELVMLFVGGRFDVLDQATDMVARQVTDRYAELDDPDLIGVWIAQLVVLTGIAMQQATAALN